MGCRNIQEKLYELKRCGCNDCYREYDNIMRNRERSRYYDIDPPRFAAIPSGYQAVPNKLLATAVDFVKEKPVEDIKNVAVKLLVDKLKVEQKALSGHQEVLANYAKTIKEYNTKKLAAQKNIKELAAALKKLGHKENI